MEQYDLIIVGGGIGGAALGKVMAEQGASVLILESTTRFQDRVRGEWLASWGVAEAKNLGIYDHMVVPDDSVFTWMGELSDVTTALFGLLFPQGSGRARAYVVYMVDSDYRLSGEKTVELFKEMLIRSGAPADIFEGANTASPLVSYSGADRWVQSPYRNSVVLIGDAAGASDPTFGQGVALTLRDVRVLRDQLLRSTDWDEACRTYAKARDRYFGTLHTYESWSKSLVYSIGPEAAAAREKAFGAWKENPTRRVDILHSGPDLVLDEEAKRRYFGD